MLDLELLEKQLDEVLSNETSESMTSWLLNRRLKKYICLLGEGDLVNMPSGKVKFTPIRIPNINNNEDFSFVLCANDEFSLLLMFGILIGVNLTLPDGMLTKSQTQKRVFKSNK